MLKKIWVKSFLIFGLASSWFFTPFPSYAIYNEKPFFLTEAIIYNVRESLTHYARVHQENKKVLASALENIPIDALQKPPSRKVLKDTHALAQFLSQTIGEGILSTTRILIERGESLLQTDFLAFIRAVDRKIFTPRPTSPLLTENQKDSARLLLERVRDLVDITNLFSPSEISQIENGQMSEELLNALVERVSAQLPELQQVIREVRTEREVQTRETQVVVDQQRIQELQNLIAQLQQKQNADFQALSQSVALSNKIDNITNVTITNPVFSAGAITDADVPDSITASNYLPLGGGTLSGNFFANASAALYASSTLQVTGNARFYGSLTVDGSTNLGSVSFSSSNVVGDQTVGGDLSVSGGDINLGTGSATTTLTSAGGKLGIGTTSPAQLLSVQGNALFSGNINAANITATGTLSLTGTSGTSTIASGQGFTIGGSKFVVQQGSGYVGIGTSTPSSPLHISSSQDSGILIIENYGADSGFTPAVAGFSAGGTISSPIATAANQDLLFLGGRGYQTETGAFGAGSKAAIRFRSAENWTSTAQGANIRFETTANGTTARTVKMTLTDAGNLGIGTTSPSEQLAISNRLYVGGSGTSTVENNLQVRGTLQTGTGSIFLGSNFLNFNQATSLNFGGAATINLPVSTSALTIATPGVNHLFINSNNNRIGFNTNNPALDFDIAYANARLKNPTAGNSPTSFQITDNTNTYTVNYEIKSGSSLSSSGLDPGDASVKLLTSNKWHVYDDNNFVSRFTVLKSGNVGVGSTTPGAKLSVAGTSLFDGLATFYNALFGNITATGTLNVSGLTTLGNASTSQISSTGSAYLATSGGSVGIGTTSPAEQLAIANRLYVGGTGTSTIENNLKIQGTLQVGTNSTFITQNTVNGVNSIFSTSVRSPSFAALAGDGNALTLSTNNVATQVNAGSVSITAGNGYSALNGSNGGAVSLTAGSNPAAGSSGGAITLTGATGFGVYNGGPVTITGGNGANASNRTGGALTFTAGQNGSGTTGASLTLSGGFGSAGSSNGYGGSIALVAGTGNGTDETAAPPANVTIKGGTRNTGSGGGGNILLVPDGSGTQSGKVGIGTSTPWGSLSIELNSTISNSATPLFVIGDSGTSSPYVYVSGANGFFGLGTSTPSKLLSVHGDSLFSGNISAANITATGTLNATGLFTFTNASGTQLTTTGSTYLATSGGNVGIGTNAPVNKLTVSGNSNISGNLGIGSAAASPSVPLHVRTGASTVKLRLEEPFEGTIDFSPSLSLPGDATIAFANSDGTRWSNIAHMTSSQVSDTYSINHANGFGILIDGSGRKFGVGTTTPSSTLSVHGNALISGNLTVANLTATGTVTVGSLGTTTVTNLQVTNTSTSTFAGFIDVNGTGTNATSTFAGNLWVKGALQTGSGSIYFDTNSIRASNGAFVLDSTSTSTLSHLALTGRVTMAGLSTDSLTIGIPGVICLDSNNELRKLAGVATCIVSSRDYKENIMDFSNGLKWVRELRPVTFDYKENGQPSLGFIAEEVDQVSPLLSVRNAAGKVYSVRYELIPAVLTKAVQELDEKLLSLEEMVSSMNVSGSVEAVKAWLESMKVYVEDGLVRLRNLVAENLTATVANVLNLKIGTAENPTGVTIYDKTTKQPYCLIMDNGQLQSIPGECSSVVNNGQHTSDSSSTTTETPTAIEPLSGPSQAPPPPPGMSSSSEPSTATSTEETSHLPSPSDPS